MIISSQKPDPVHSAVLECLDLRHPRNRKKMMEMRYRRCGSEVLANNLVHLSDSLGYIGWRRRNERRSKILELI
jgi:hypothetical protein